MDWLVNLIPGGTLTVVGSAIMAILGFGVYFWKQAFNSGRDKERAKEAERDAQEMARIRAAARAKPTGSVHDDPHNRDNK